MALKKPLEKITFLVYLNYQVDMNHMETILSNKKTILMFSFRGGRRA
jgi:hypothetical protein